MSLTRNESEAIATALRRLCAEGFIDAAKQIAKLTDAEISARIKRGDFGQESA